MKLFEQIGVAGTLLSRAAGTVVAPCLRTDVPWTGRHYDAGAVRARRAAAVDIDAADAEVVSPEFLPVALDLPVKKQPLVPLCPSERST